MALLTLSEESPLTIADNSALTVSVFHGLARNFGLCTYMHPVTKDSVLMVLAQNIFAGSAQNYRL